MGLGSSVSLFGSGFHLSRHIQTLTAAVSDLPLSFLSGSLPSPELTRRLSLEPSFPRPASESLPSPGAWLRLWALFERRCRRRPPGGGDKHGPAERRAAPPPLPSPHPSDASAPPAGGRRRRQQ